MEGKKGLSGTELVEALLLGSAEIDQMRKEIDQVVRMIIGRLDADRSVTLAYYRNLSGSFSWTSDDGRTGGAWYLHHDGFYSIRFIYMGCSVYDSASGSRSRGAAHDIPLRAVQDVHAALGALASGIKDAFPSLSGYWMMLLDAAAAAKKRVPITD